MKESLFNEDIRTGTGRDRTSSAARATRTWNSKTENRERQIMSAQSRATENNQWFANRQYLVTQKRGQRTLLLPEWETLSRAFDYILSSGQAVTAELFSRVAIGIAELLRVPLTSHDTSR